MSPLLMMDVMLQLCSLKHPSVKDDNTTTLFAVQNAMAIPADAFVETLAFAKDVGNGLAEEALCSQILFSFDSVMEILKNCSRRTW